MKKKFKLFSFVFLFVLFTSCQNDTNDFIDDLSLNSSQFDVDMDMIAKLGFSIENVVDKGDYYLVEGDIAFIKGESYETEISSDSSKIELRQASTSNTITLNNAADLKIMINSGLNDGWKNAISSAVKYYNSILSNVQMRIVTSNPDITIQYGNIGNNWGQGAFPTADGKAGKTVLLKNDSKSEQLTHDQKVFLVVHELGHNIGMRHTDYQIIGESGAIPITGTPNTDYYSVFNSGNAFGGQVVPWAGFTKNDVKAVQTLYPLRISKSTTSGGIGERVTFSIDHSQLSANSIQWTSLSGLKLVSGQSSKSATFEITANGDVTARVKIISSMNQHKENGRLGEPVTLSLDAYIWAGVPKTPDLSHFPSQFYSGQYRELSLRNTEPGTTYKWNIFGVSDVIQYNNSVSFKVNKFYYDGGVSVSVVATNKYGSSQPAEKIIFVKGLGGNSGGGHSGGTEYPLI